MSLSLADQILIRSIFYLNTSQKINQESSDIFSWEGNNPGSGWTEYLYIHDDLGKVQWIFPAYSSYPAFISLQNSAYPLSKSQKLRYKIFFRLGWKNQLSNGAFFVKNEEELPLYELLHSVPHESFSILTNTTGKYRKSVVALNRGKYPSHYIKLAHSPIATELVYNEVYALQILSQRRLRRVVHPFLSHTDGDHAIIISNVKPQKAIFSRDLKPVHYTGIQDLYKNFSHFRFLNDLPYVHNIGTYLKEIQQSSESYRKQGFKGLAKKMEQLLHSYNDFTQQIPQDGEIWVSLSHGDFLPWNMYITDKRIYLFDWEYMQESLPLLYDFFYFIYHTHLTYFSGESRKVRETVQTFIKNPLLKEITDTYSIEPDFYHKLYLMIDIPYLLHRELNREIPLLAEELEIVFDYWAEILDVQSPS